MWLCRSAAEAVKDTANKTRVALELSEEAIEKAETALKDALNNLNSTQTAAMEVQHATLMSV